MDLALPRFQGLGDGSHQVHRPWKVLAESPACLNLDELSLSDDTVGSARLSDLSVTLLCGLDDGHTPVNSDQALSDVDLPPETSQTIRDKLSGYVCWAWDSRWTVSKGGSRKWMPLPMCIPVTTTSGRDLDVAPRLVGPDPPPVVGTVEIPEVESVESVPLSSPPMSGQLSPASPQTVALEDLGGLFATFVPKSCSGGAITGRSG